MSHAVSAMEARKKFGEILNRVSMLNEEIIIERAGHKIARLIAMNHQPKKPSGKLDFRKSAGLGKDIWQKIDSTRYVKQERTEWE